MKTEIKYNQNSEGWYSAETTINDKTYKTDFYKFKQYARKKLLKIISI